VLSVPAFEWTGLRLLTVLWRLDLYLHQMTVKRHMRLDSSVNVSTATKHIRRRKTSE